jgi:hypothetical protein
MKNKKIKEKKKFLVPIDVGWRKIFYQLKAEENMNFGPLVEHCLSNCIEIGKDGKPKLIK